MPLIDRIDTMSARPYSLDDIARAYEAAGVRAGKVVFLTSDFGRLGGAEVRNKDDLLEAHLSALQKLLGNDGTLVVPSGCTQIANSDVVFDVDTTPSARVGAFSEFVRTRPGAMRSFHPFVSYAALGKYAREITQNVSRHAFGPETPFARMLELDAVCVSVGREVRYTATVAHHAELLCAVPYRYTKEFIHPVLRDGKVQEEAFYLHVQYLNSDVERGYQEQIAERFIDCHQINMYPLGRSAVWGYSMREYFNHCVKEIVADPYVWCKAAPTQRPWQL